MEEEAMRLLIEQQTQATTSVIKNEPLDGYIMDVDFRSNWGDAHEKATALAWELKMAQEKNRQLEMALAEAERALAETQAALKDSKKRCDRYRDKHREYNERFIKRDEKIKALETENAALITQVDMMRARDEERMERIEKLENRMERVQGKKSTT